MARVLGVHLGEIADQFVAAAITVRGPVAIFFTVIDNRNSSFSERPVSVGDHSQDQIEQPDVPIANDVKHGRFRRVGGC